jgi:hypothetical protein
MHEMIFDRTSTVPTSQGCFLLDYGSLSGAGARRWLELFFTRADTAIPLQVQFAGPADLRTLGRALLAEADAWDGQTPLPH